MEGILAVGSPAAGIAAAGMTWWDEEFDLDQRLNVADQVMESDVLEVTEDRYNTKTAGPCESLTEDLTEMQRGDAIAFNQKGFKPRG